MRRYSKCGGEKILKLKCPKKCSSLWSKSSIMSFMCTNSHRWSTPRSSCWSSLGWFDSVWPQILIAASDGHFSLLLCGKVKIGADKVQEKKPAHFRLKLSPSSYLARWSTASTMLVPSLALVSQNKAPYACKQSIHIPDFSLFALNTCINTVPPGEIKTYTPWPTFPRAKCSHTFPLEASPGGPPCFQ